MVAPFMLALLFSAVFVQISLALTPDEAALKGVQYFAKRCESQKLLVKDLVSAIKSGNLKATKAAYVDSRPPYEEIEVLAPSFPELDEAIDARPYTFETGEDDPNFRGFHVVERALYREKNVSAALEPAKDLYSSVIALCDALNNAPDSSTFSAYNSWEGLLGLAFEVPAKKISSEEETWSDLSITIFRANFKGIYETFKPFQLISQPPSKAQVSAVKETYAKLVTFFNMLDMKNGFVGRNGGAARAYSDVGVNKRRTLQKLAYEFATRLATIREELSVQIPEVMPEIEAEKPEEKVLNMKNLNMAAYEGIRYFSAKCALQTSLAFDLHTHMESPQATIASARAAYLRARPPYEQIETIASSFLQEDSDIDSRPYAFDYGELSPEFRGFHIVERALYRDNDLPNAIAAMPALIASIASLCKKLANPDAFKTFDADTTWKGMIALAYEVPAKKISSEEETYSDLSLLIYRENAKGIYSQFLPFSHIVSSKARKRVANAYKSIKDYFINVADPANNWSHGTNFRPYSKVPISHRAGISNRFYELARALIYAKKTLK